MEAPNRTLVTILLFAGCVAFHLIGTWSVPLIDRDEPRFAEASREMIEGGNYIVPHFNNQLRLDKPPLAYWAQVASFRIFGENDFAARFPSAIAAALVALALFSWGNKIGDERTGWWAAMIFTLALQTFLHAKAAVADMWLVLFVTLAHWAGYELMRRATTNWKWWGVFYVSLALGFLAKGPIAWTPLLTLAAAKYFFRDISFARRFRFGRGILLMLGIVALWAAPALIQTHGEFFRIGIGRHVIGRSFSAMESHGSNSLGIYLLLLPFYSVTILVSFLPWTVCTPALIKRLRVKRRENRLWQDAEQKRVDIYLLCGAAVIFVIFSLIKTKLPHYTLPAFPLLSLLLARNWMDPTPAKLDRLNQSSFARADLSLKRIAVATVCLYLALAFIGGPLASPYFPAKQLFEQARADLRPEMEFAALDFQEPSLVWYFRSKAKGWMSPVNMKNAAEFMKKNGGRFLILPTASVSKTFPDLPPTWKIYSTSGFNVAKGKSVDLSLVLKPE